MILPPDAVCDLMNQIERGKDGILLVKDHLSRVDSKNARASMAEDEVRVKQKISNSVGFQSVDQGITEFLIQWMATEVQHYMKKLTVAKPGTRPSLVSCAADTRPVTELDGNIRRAIWKHL